MNGYRCVLEISVGQVSSDQLPQIGGLEEGVRRSEPSKRAPQRQRKYIGSAKATPDRRQVGYPSRRRIACEETGVERADRGTHDEIRGHPRLKQRLQHAHLHRAETSTSLEHEGGPTRGFRHIRGSCEGIGSCSELFRHTRGDGCRFAGAVGEVCELPLSGEVEW